MLASLQYGYVRTPRPVGGRTSPDGHVPVTLKYDNVSVSYTHTCHMIMFVSVIHVSVKKSLKKNNKKKHAPITS